MLEAIPAKIFCSALRLVAVVMISEAAGVHEVIELSTPPPVPATKLSILFRTGRHAD